jgi:hypothetical protein
LLNVTRCSPSRDGGRSNEAFCTGDVADLIGGAPIAAPTEHITINKLTTFGMNLVMFDICFFERLDVARRFFLGAAYDRNERPGGQAR